MTKSKNNQDTFLDAYKSLEQDKKELKRLLRENDALQSKIEENKIYIRGLSRNIQLGVEDVVFYKTVKDITSWK